jgi:hypothetical protein
MPALAALIWSAVTFLIQEVLIKFFILAALFFLIVNLTPLLVSALGSSLSSTGISEAFSSIPSGVWFFLDFFALDVGIPLLISAHVTRFVIRRLPVIG